jgi:hypothetical protein
MTRFILSLLIGLIIGFGIGLGLGWWGPEPFSIVVVDNPLSDLDDKYKEEYTVMVAGGYLVDGDTMGAVERLRILAVDNVPLYVQELTERFITNSRDLEEIKRLVALSEGLGRLTPIMEPYRIVTSSSAQ